MTGCSWNRKERGKKKLADRWDSTVYTVVDVNTETHTYRIRDTITGREKVVHRNLLMLVNFLPVGDTCDISDLASSLLGTGSSVSGHDGGEAEETSSGRGRESLSVASESFDTEGDSESPVTVTDGQGPLTDAVPVDSESRTIEWITQLSGPSLAEACIVDMSVASDPQNATISLEGSTTDQSVTCYSCPSTAADVSTDLRQSDFALDTMTQTDNTSDSLHTVVQVSPAHPGRFNAQVRSRFGRLINPVNRLIQTMSRQDVVQE